MDIHQPQGAAFAPCLSRLGQRLTTSGSGLGRAAAFVHLLTGAGAIAIEIQSNLVVAARGLVTRLLVSRVSCIEGDAVKLTGFIMIGSVFFL